MNILVIGLGNHGKQYENTRHNAGFMLLDRLKEQLHATSTEVEHKQAKNSYISFTFETTSHNLTLLYPQTFMNRSGEAVHEYLRYHQASTIYLAHDDLDLALGSYKLQLNKSPRDHNGVISVEQHLEDKDIWRIRLGVDNRANTPFAGSGADYVLHKFSADELAVIAESIEAAKASFMAQIS